MFSVKANMLDAAGHRFWLCKDLGDARCVCHNDTYLAPPIIRFQSTGDQGVSDIDSITQILGALLVGGGGDKLHLRHAV